MTSMPRGRYRFRTWLRGHLPEWIATRFPRGKQDCGAHEWHRSDPATWRCYHCDVGVTHVSPFAPAEEIAGRLAALELKLDALAGKPPDKATRLEQTEILDEARSLLRSSGARALAGDRLGRPGSV
jgi:hypothetical protein